MIHGKKKSFKGSLYFKKAHYCPKCQTQMQTIVLKKIIDSKAREDKQHSFRLTDETYLAGNVEFSWKELKCPNCCYQLTVEEMQRIESEALDYEQLLKQEKKEKIKVAIFTFGVIIFALILIIILFNK